MPSKLHKDRRRVKYKGGTTGENKVTYATYTPTGNYEWGAGGPVPEMKEEIKTDVLPKGTKGKEVFVYGKADAEGKRQLKKIKRKYKTDDAVYKSKTKRRGDWIKQCKGPGVDCEDESESVSKRKRIFKKKKK